MLPLPPISCGSYFVVERDPAGLPAELKTFLARFSEAARRLALDAGSDSLFVVNSQAADIVILAGQEQETPDHAQLLDIGNKLASKLGLSPVSPFNARLIKQLRTKTGHIKQPSAFDLDELERGPADAQPPLQQRLVSLAELFEDCHLVGQFEARPGSASELGSTSESVAQFTMLWGHLGASTIALLGPAPSSPEADRA